MEKLFVKLLARVPARLSWHKSKTPLHGALMNRWNLYKSLMIFGWLQAIAILGFVLLAVSGKNFTLFAAVVFFEHVTSGMGTTAFFAFLKAISETFSVKM